VDNERKQSERHTVVDGNKKYLVELGKKSMRSKRCLEVVKYNVRNKLNACHFVIIKTEVDKLV
jgi:hypothetical protein